MTNADMSKQDRHPLVAERTPENPSPEAEYVQCSLKAPEKLGAAASTMTLPSRPHTEGFINEVSARRSTVQEWINQGIPFTEGRPHPTDSKTTEQLEQWGIKGYTSYNADGTIRSQTNL